MQADSTATIIQIQPTSTQTEHEKCYRLYIGIDSFYMIHHGAHIYIKLYFTSVLARTQSLYIANE